MPAASVNTLFGRCCAHGSMQSSLSSIAPTKRPGSRRRTRRANGPPKPDKPDAHGRDRRMLRDTTRPGSTAPYWSLEMALSRCLFVVSSRRWRTTVSSSLGLAPSTGRRRRSRPSGRHRFVRRSTDVVVDGRRGIRPYPRHRRAKAILSPPHGRDATSGTVHAGAVSQLFDACTIGCSKREGLSHRRLAVEPRAILPTTDTARNV